MSAAQRPIVKCETCGQQNRVSDGATTARCGRCKQPLDLDNDGWGAALTAAAKAMKTMPDVPVPVGAAADARIGELERLLREIGGIVNSVAPAAMTQEMSEIATRLSLSGYLDEPDDAPADGFGDDIEDEGEDDDG